MPLEGVNKHVASVRKGAYQRARVDMRLVQVHRPIYGGALQTSFHRGSKCVHLEPAAVTKAPGDEGAVEVCPGTSPRPTPSERTARVKT